MSRMRAGADVEEMRVDRLALHMLRMFGHLARPPAQHRVGLRRAVGGENVDRLRRAQFAIDLPDDVEQMRVHLGRLVEPPVAAEPVQLVEHRLIVDAVDHEGERAGFVGVLVREDDGARVAVGDRRFGRVRNKPSRAERRRHRHLRRRSAAADAFVHFKARQQPILPQHVATGGEAGGLCLSIPTLTLLPASPADPRDLPSAASPALPLRIVTLASQLRQKAICFAYSPISPPFQS